MNRFLDIPLAVAALAVTSPLWLVAAVGIKMDSCGPVFFLQKRVGRGNRDFRIYKFRTMKIDNGSGALITVGGRDSRVTRFGYYLRRFKIDELPQLLNVLKGDMSFVGPRPEVRKYVEMYSPEQLRVLEVRPGITSPASIKYRNENEILANAANPEETYIKEVLPDKLKLDLEYINHRSFRHDLQLLFQTLTSLAGFLSKTADNQ